eukprot:772777-Prymnesium_polylepis.1
MCDVPKRAEEGIARRQRQLGAAVLKGARGAQREAQADTGQPIVDVWSQHALCIIQKRHERVEVSVLEGSAQGPGAAAVGAACQLLGRSLRQGVRPAKQGIRLVVRVGVTSVRVLPYAQRPRALLSGRVRQHRPLVRPADTPAQLLVEASTIALAERSAHQQRRVVGRSHRVHKRERQRRPRDRHQRSLWVGFAWRIARTVRTSLQL